jgi:hypothetical protein
MYSKNRRESKVSLPFDWDFLQDNLPQEKLAELRRRFMEVWRSGEYTSTSHDRRMNHIENSRMRTTKTKVSKPWDNPFAERGIRTKKRTAIS